MSIKTDIKNWKKAKKYVESLGYELGPYSFEIRGNVVLTDDPNSPIKGDKRAVGSIDVNNLQSFKLKSSFKGEKPAKLNFT